MSKDPNEPKDPHQLTDPNSSTPIQHGDEAISPIGQLSSPSEKPTFDTSVVPIAPAFEQVLDEAVQKKQSDTSPVSEITNASNRTTEPEWECTDIATEVDEDWEHMETETELVGVSESMESSFPTHLDIDEWKQLHPYSLLINLLPQMARTIQNAWPLLLFIVLGNNQGQQVVDSIFVLFFIGISIVRTMIHFFTLRYRVQEGKLILKMGLISRQARTLDPTRIQNMEITQNLLHKYFNLVELKLETAGDSSTKGLLSALSKEDAQELKQALQHSRRRTTHTEDAEGTPDLALSWGEVLLFGLSRRTVGTVVVLSAVVSEAMTTLHPNQAQQVASSITLSIFIGLMAISFAVSWIWSSIQATLRYHKLELRLQSDDVRIVSGLITKRSVEIPLHKVQTIEWFEPWLRRQMGFGTLYLETAALGMDDGQVRRSEGVLPMVERDKLSDVLMKIAPLSATEIVQTEQQAPNPRARWMILFTYLIPAVLSTGFAWWSLEVSGLSLLLISSLALLIVAGLTELDFQMQRWAITPHAILSRSGYLNRRTWIVDRQKVQSVYRGEDPILQLLGLSQVVIQVAGSTVYLPLVTEAKAQEILDNLTEDWQS